MSFAHCFCKALYVTVVRNCPPRRTLDIGNLKLAMLPRYLKGDEQRLKKPNSLKNELNILSEKAVSTVIAYYCM